MKTKCYIFLLFTLLISCNKNKSFSYDDEIAKLTDKDLRSWLKKAKFNNEFAVSDDKKFYITNAQEIFPFMGKYYDDFDQLRNINQNESPIYKQEVILYKDSKWGDIYVMASLLTENVEVYKDSFNSEVGGGLFEVPAGGLASYSSSLQETSVITNNKKNEKSALYWANAGNSSYLVAFYQKNKQLVFEMVIPLLKNDTLATVNKLKEVNTDLGLFLKPWQVAQVSDVKPQNTTESFWKNPYLGIYLNEYTIDDVYLPIKNTPFKESAQPLKGDFYFFYQSSKGLVELFTYRKDAPKTETEFAEQNKGSAKLENANANVYVKEKEEVNNVNGIAKSYMRDNKYLEIHYQYPKNDIEAKERIYSILKYMKVHIY